MATHTQILSMPTSTAPSESTASTHIPCQAPESTTTYEPESLPMPAEWDPNCIPNLLFPTDHRLGGFAEHGNSSGNDIGKSVEEACKRSLNHFPCPSLSFSMPVLEFDFRLAVKLNPTPARTEGNAQREITTVTAGVWSGSFGHGRVIAGGYDLGQARGFRPMRLLEGAFVVQTSEEAPAVLEMRTRGSLSGPCDVLDALLTPCQPKDIDPRRYNFRMFATIKTSDKRYSEIVNCGLWVASGTWRADQLIIDAYRVT